MRISEYRTVINGTEEMDFSKFIKQFKDNSISYVRIDYNEEKGEFIVHICDEEEVLELPANVDKDILDQLIQVVDRYRTYKNKHDINKRVLDTGALPTSKTEMAFYKDYLNEKYSESKAKLVKEKVVTILPVVLIGLSVYFGKDLLSFENVTFWNLILRVSLTCASGLSGLCLTDHWFESNLKKYSEEYKLYKRKLDVLKERESMLEYDLLFDEAPSKENNKELLKITIYKNIFLKEAKKVAMLIDLLPKEERSSYSTRVVALVNEFHNKLNVVGGNNRISSRNADYIWKIVDTFIPYLYIIELEVRERLDAIIKEKDTSNESNSIIDLLQQHDAQGNVLVSKTM